MQGPKDAALGGVWGLILGPVKFPLHFCHLWLQLLIYNIISSAVGEALSLGPSAAQEQTVLYRKFAAPTAEGDLSP